MRLPELHLGECLLGVNINRQRSCEFAWTCRSKAMLYSYTK